MTARWRELIVGPEATLLQVLQVIDRGAMQFAMVVRDESLLGIVTDGDIRRALVRGLGTDAKIEMAMNTKPVLGRLDDGPAGWRRKMRQNGIRHLPVVDEARRVQRLITEHGFTEVRANWAILMAGGLGTRLRPITERIPKPMIEVGGRPILETILDMLALVGYRRLYISVNYRAEIIERHFGDGSKYGVEIEYLRESVPMGTAGALSLLPQKPAAPMLVMNGDVLTGLDLGAFVDAHTESSAAITVGVRQLVTQIPYGVVDLQDDHVVAIREKPEVRSAVSAGIYALSPEVLALVPRGGFLDMPTLIANAIEGRYRVRAHPIAEYWIDVGRLDDLERARLESDQGET